MSESRKALLELIEQDPETRALAPVLRVLFELPTRSVASFIALANLWDDLGYERRALLVLSLKEVLPITRVAALCGVHRRTLYKNKFFREVLKKLRDSSRRPPCRDIGPDDDDIDDDFDPWATG